MSHGQPLDLHFSLLETVSVVIAVGVLALVCNDGETHWMEGVMMLGVYVIVALAFYNLPDWSVFGFRIASGGRGHCFAQL